MRRLIVCRTLAILGAGVVLAFGARDAAWASSPHGARSDVPSRSSSIVSGSAGSTHAVTEAIHEPELVAVGRSPSESSRPPIGSVFVAVIVAAGCAFRRRASGGRIRSVWMLVSRLGSRAPPALSLI